MELNLLGQEYLQLSCRITDRIHALTPILKELTGSDKIIMKRRILSLYIDAAECRTIAKILSNYNKKGENLNEQNNF